jgi:hypothetical protein
VIDLDEGGSESLKLLETARAGGTVPPLVIGFLSHIDRDLGAEARAAGVKTVPRGRFWSHLAEVLEG